MTTHEIEQYEASMPENAYGVQEEAHASEDCKERKTVTYYFRNKKHVGTKTIKEVLGVSGWFQTENSLIGINPCEQ